MKDSTICASEFKAKCLAILDRVEARGGRVVITKRGRPVAVVVPVSGAAPVLRGSWKDKIRVHGDLVRFSELDDWKNP